MEPHQLRRISKAVLSDGDCPLDSIPIRQHLRCACCSILIGPKHYASKAVQRNGYTYCDEHCADCHSRKAWK